MVTRPPVGRPPLQVVQLKHAELANTNGLNKGKLEGVTTPRTPDESTSFDSAREDVTPSPTFTEPVGATSTTPPSTINHKGPESRIRRISLRGNGSIIILDEEPNCDSNIPWPDLQDPQSLDHKESWPEPTSPLPSTPVVLDSPSTLRITSGLTNRTILDSPSFRRSRLTRPTFSSLLPGLGRNDTLRSNSTNDSLGCFASSDYCVRVQLPGTDLVWPFRGASGLYVGYEDKVVPPAYCAEKWSKHLKPRLWTDIFEFQKNIIKKSKRRCQPPGMSTELRMSGYATKVETHVQLFPRVWILYDDERWKKEVKRFARESEWLEHEGFGKVEVRRGSPRLSTKTASVPVQGLVLEPQHGFSLGEDLHLYLHVEKLKDNCQSTNGLVFCATTTRTGQVCGQRLSRIGGSASLNATNVVVTTGHGIFELLVNLMQDESTADDDELFSSTDTSEDDSDPKFSPYDDSSDDDSDSGSGLSDVDDFPWPNALGGIDPEIERDWVPVEMHGLTSFLGISDLDLTRLLHRFANRIPFVEPATSPLNSGDTDFSVWSLRHLHAATNEFSHGNPASKLSIVALPCMSPSVGPAVTIILGPETTLSGSCLPGYSEFMIHGVTFTTRKIRTEAPLAPGCSGAWVVTRYTYSLLGMIVASYDNEPYVHMVTRETLFGDIEAALPKGFNVTLPSKDSGSVQSLRILNTEKQNDSPRQYEQEASIMTENIIAERQRLWRTPAFTFFMTPGERRNILEKLGLAILKAHEIPQDFSVGDEGQVKALVRFRLQLGAQYLIGPSGTVLKDHLSITEQDLDNGIALIENILQNIPTAERSRIKYASGTEGHSQVLGWVKAMSKTQTTQTSNRRSTPPSNTPPPRVVTRRRVPSLDRVDEFKPKRARIESKPIPVVVWTQHDPTSTRPGKSNYTPDCSFRNVESQIMTDNSKITATTASYSTVELGSTPGSSTSTVSRDFGFSQPMTDIMDSEPL